MSTQVVSFHMNRFLPKNVDVSKRHVAEDGEGGAVESQWGSLHDGCAGFAPTFAIGA